MPCFTLQLQKRNTPYQLSQLILDQVNLGSDETAIGYGWREINVQSHLANDADNPLKVGDENISGMRYGMALRPGESKKWNVMPAYSYTKDKWFLSDVDNQAILVELI